MLNHPYRTPNPPAEVKLKKMTPIINFISLFVGFRFIRKFIGGRWEKWYVDFPVSSSIWHQVDINSKEYLYFQKPTPLCHGIPLDIEIYPEKYQYEKPTDVCMGNLVVRRLD